MKNIFIAAAGALGAALAFPLAANAAPLGAAGQAVAPAALEQSNIIQVQRVQRGPRVVNRSRVLRGGPRVIDRSPRGYRPGPRIVTRGGYGYFGPHRGYRYARPGYRYYSGYWFPPAAFAAGALIGGVIASQAAPVGVYGGGLSPQHYAWCEQRYISYRAADNSFQPYEGPRQACVSPYS